MNNKGKMELPAVLLWAAVIVAILYFVGFAPVKSTIDGFLGTSTPSSSGQTDTNLVTNTCPSSGKTTVVLNTQDALATTATNVNAEYYLFDGATLAYSGKTASGTASFDVTCGKTYKAVVLNTTATSGAYAEYFDVDAYTASKTFNKQLVQFGGALINSIQNPNDPSRLANVSLVAGATKSFEIYFSANVTAKGYNKPVIICSANVTTITDVKIASFSDGTVPVKVSTPKRITAEQGDQLYAYEYPKLLEPSVGTIVARGSLTADKSTAPATTDTITCRLVDQATWKSASYQSKSLDAGLVTGPENTEDANSDVGALDSSTSSYTLQNAGGY